MALTIVSRFDTSKVLRTHPDPKATDFAGADLSGTYLSGADLSGAYLSRADLSGADLSRADLSGADLSGAYLSGAFILDKKGCKTSLIRLITQIDRQNGGYRFHAFKTEDKGLIIKAGCRTFNSTDAYRVHVEQEYPGTPKAKETLAILAFIDTLATLEA